MKYLVVRDEKQKPSMYKRYKCIDGWTRHSEICWKFSKQGAKQIADRETKFNRDPNVSFRIIPTEYSE